MVDDCSLKIARHSLSGYVASVLSDSPASRFVRLSVYPFVSPSFLIRLSVDLKPYTRHIRTRTHARAHTHVACRLSRYSCRSCHRHRLPFASFLVSMDFAHPPRYCPPPFHINRFLFVFKRDKRKDRSIQADRAGCKNFRFISVSLFYFSFWDVI